MRFALGINDAYIYPSGEDWAELTLDGSGVFHSLKRVVEAADYLIDLSADGDDSIHKVDIEVQDDDGNMLIVLPFYDDEGGGVV